MSTVLNVVGVRVHEYCKLTVNTDCTTVQQTSPPFEKTLFYDNFKPYIAENTSDQY